MKNITYNLFLAESSDMPIAFRSACSCYNQESISWSEGYADFYILQFVVEGSGILRCSGEEHKLKPGCAFFVRLGQAFEYINTGGLKSAFVSMLLFRIRSLLIRSVIRREPTFPVPTPCTKVQK